MLEKSDKPCFLKDEATKAPSDHAIGRGQRASCFIDIHKHNTTRGK